MLRNSPLVAMVPLTSTMRGLYLDTDGTQHLVAYCDLRGRIKGSAFTIMT